MFSPIFVVDTKIIFRYDFVAPLIEYNQVIAQDEEIAKIFNKYFKSIPILNMPTDQECEYSDSPEKKIPL